MEQIVELLVTIMEAIEFITVKRNAGQTQEAAFMADSVNASVEAVTGGLRGLNIELPASVLCDREMFADDALIGKWLESISGWHRTAVNELLSLQQTPARKQRYPVDNNFYALINEFKSSPVDKLLYRMKGNFQKLVPEHKTALANYATKFPLWGALDLEKNNFNLLHNKTASFAEHWQEYLWLYNRLGDYRSKHLLFAILNNWYNFDIQGLDETKEVLYSDYFDMDLVRCTQNEVMVDLGAFTGNAVMDYMSTYGQGCYKRIYCYEPSPIAFSTLKSNLSKLPNIECRMCGVGARRGTMRMSAHATDRSDNSLALADGRGDIVIDVVPIDEDITEPVTLIKMDIEGAEQDALQGCVEHIKRSHPKLLLSVYHNNEDWWKLARMVEDVCPGYRFYLRSHGGNLWPTEVTLIAIYEN